MPLGGTAATATAAAPGHESDDVGCQRNDLAGEVNMKLWRTSSIHYWSFAATCCQRANGAARRPLGMIYMKLWQHNVDSVPILPVSYHHRANGAARRFLGMIHMKLWQDILDSLSNFPRDLLPPGEPGSETNSV